MNDFIDMKWNGIKMLYLIATDDERKYAFIQKAASGTTFDVIAEIILTGTNTPVFECTTSTLCIDKENEKEYNLFTGDNSFT